MARELKHWDKHDRERFWAFVSLPKRKGGKACYLWNGALNEKGYGIFRLATGAQRAHRVAYCIHNDLPLRAIRGLDIHHTHDCDNACVRGDHLVARDGKGHDVEHATLKARSQRYTPRRFKQR